MLQENKYTPIHLNKWTRSDNYGGDDLSEYYARTYRPIWEYGGWGIRCSFGKGKAYNVSGNKGVQLVFKSGKRLLIGSQRADELEEALSKLERGGQIRWFLSGAAVLLAGFFLGFSAKRQRRRSSLLS